MTDLTPPATFDPWTTVRWAIENQGRLYVKVIVPNTNPAEPVRTKLTCLKDLAPQSWVHHVKRLHFDPTHQMWTQEHWARYESEQAAPLADF